MSDTPHQHLSLGRIAKLCHVSRTTAYRWIINGRLKGYSTPGGHFRVAPEDLSAFCRVHGIPDPLEQLGAEGGEREPIDPDSSAAHPAVDPNSPRRILIADDHADMVSVLRRVVERYAPTAEIQESVNGVDTCIVAATWQPDVILLDIMMPGMDGFAVLQELLRREELTKTQVIVVSAYEPFERVQNLQHQYQHVVSSMRKPIKIEELGDQIVHALAGSGVRSGLK